MHRHLSGFRPVIAVLAALLLSAGESLFGQEPPYGEPSTPATPLASQADGGLDDLVRQLGDADFRTREATTARVLALGESVGSGLRARLEQESDPEIRFRLRFILDNIQPPDLAVLVVRSDLAAYVEPGDLITHVNNRRVRSRLELLQRLQDTRAGCILRLRGPNGPREVGPLYLNDLPLVINYRAPQGETIAQVVRRYHAGYAERAYELLNTLSSGPDVDALPDSELPELLRAIIACTAGDTTGAERLLAGHADAAEPVGGGPTYSPWTNPSGLDLAGPRKAPFHLEARLWDELMARAGDAQPDPDMPVQRVLVPAGRYPDALRQVAALWRQRYRTTLGEQADSDRAAGNMLAVSAWMLSEMDLLSECLRLIEPRSQILRAAPQSVRKWIRVRTDAWLSFVHGQPREALDGFFEDARLILRPPGPPASRIHIQNPAVAAQVAFFLYQFPTDERVTDMLSLLAQPNHPALAEYTHWMMFALSEDNAAVVREHLLKLLPAAVDDGAADLARAVALLEYTRASPDRDVLAAARERMAGPDADAQRSAWLNLIDVLERLAAVQPDLARQSLRGAEGLPGASVLGTTADFLSALPARATDLAALRSPLLAVPIGRGGSTWIVLTRTHELLRFQADTGELTPVERPSPTWYPGPLNWPWLGREETSGRVWIYDRRRVVEVAQDGTSPLVLNISTEDIGAFDQYAGPAFSALGAALAASERGAGVTSGEQRGEFWGADLQVGRESFADPALPEIGLIRLLPDDPRIVHIAFRGGPQLLVELSHGRTWDTAWIGTQLASLRPNGVSAATPAWFLAKAVPPAGATQPPLLFLMSNVGFIRFDVAEEKLTYLELPGAAPHAAVLPERCPYERRDPRWVYCAQLPEEGGRVFRVSVADNRVENVDMINEGIDPDFYVTQSRAALRARIDALFAAEGLPPLREFITDAEERVSHYAAQSRP